MKVKNFEKVYLSFEDAFWDVLRSFNINSGIILVPNFYCVDVLNNMRVHGLIPKYYSLDTNLQPIEADLLVKIKKYQPKFIVLLHAVGITNRLVNRKFFQKVKENIFIIEDGVHRITDRKNLKIFDMRHIYIDSWRKVLPLQGSLLVARAGIVNKLKGPEKIWSYSTKVIFLWSLMWVFRLINLKKMADKFMWQGYDLIGDSYLPSGTLPIFKWLFDRIDIEKIKLQKVAKVKACLKKIKTIKFRKSDWGELRGFPVVCRYDQYLDCRGELLGCPWTKNRKIIYLPIDGGEIIP